MLKFFIFVATGFFISIQTKAQSADQPADPKSQVEQIQKNFTDKSAREKYIRETPQAAVADKELTHLVGNGELKDQSYQTSAELFKYIMDKNANDPKKAQEDLMRAMQDPEKFINSLPESIKNKIKNIAASVEKKSAKP